MTLVLRPAVPEDREDIFRWLARSDATPQMMGLPTFPDAPVPTFAGFCADYDDSFLADGGPGRLHVMEVDGRGIGAISDFTRECIAEIDLWIASRADWGRGYGSAAIRQLAGRLFARGDVEALIIRPSARNARAVAAYRKAGFEIHDASRHTVPDWVLTEGLDYADAVVLVWTKPG